MHEDREGASFEGKWVVNGGSEPTNIFQFAELGRIGEQRFSAGTDGCKHRPPLDWNHRDHHRIRSQTHTRDTGVGGFYCALAHSNCQFERRVKHFCIVDKSNTKALRHLQFLTTTWFFCATAPLLIQILLSECFPHLGFSNLGIATQVLRWRLRTCLLPALCAPHGA